MTGPSHAVNRGLSLVRALVSVAPPRGGRSKASHAPGVAWLGAGEGNRTLVVSLEGFCSTIELHPQYQ